MDDQFAKSEDILNFVKQCRKVIQHVIDSKDEIALTYKALLFVTMMQNMQELVAQLVEVDNKEDRTKGMKMLDEAIQRLEDHNDELFMGTKTANFLPKVKGEA